MRSRASWALALLLAPAVAVAPAENMTLAAAMDVLQSQGPLPSDLRVLFQALRRSNTSSSRALRREGSAEVNITATRETLNTMIEEAGKKRDIEEIRCEEAKARQLEMIEETRQDATFLSAQAVGARGKMLAAEAAIQQANKALPKLEETLRVHAEKCATDLSAMQAQLDLVSGDMSVANNLTANLDCAAQGGAALLQCVGEAGNRSFLTFARPSLRSLAAQLRSPEAQRVLQETLASAVEEHGLPPQLSSSRVLINHRRSRTRRQSPVVPNTGSNSIVPEGTSHQDEAQAAEKAQKKCTMAASPDCESTLDRLMGVIAGIADSQESTRSRIAKAKDDCAASERLYKTQVASVEAQHKDASTALTEATAAQSAYAEQARLKNAQVADLDKDYHKTLESCEANLKAFEQEICGVRSVRAELHTLAKADPYIQDCQVSEWVPESCSVSCGGGHQKLTRSVVSLAHGGGADCPPLAMERRCNERACPVDCEVAEWDEWSSCTSRCGGGVRQRARTILKEPTHGGKSCGQTSETQSCNGHSCDRACDLSDWSEWSSCSKMCNKGLQTRTKTVVHPAEGAGACPGPDDKSRLEYDVCNQQACVVSEGNATLQCASKTDLLLLLDGSGSIGQEGWEATKAAARTLLEAFHGEHGDRRVGVVSFGGPRKWHNYERCTSGPEQGQKPPDLETDCGIYTVSRFSEHAHEVAQKVPGLMWPGGSTLASAALMAASAGLAEARSDAHPIVVVITDGKPLSHLKTGRAAAKVQSQARLFWVVVNRYDSLEEVKHWASTPHEENVVRVSDFHTLTANSTISTLVSSICSKVA